MDIIIMACTTSLQISLSGLLQKVYLYKRSSPTKGLPLQKIYSTKGLMLQIYCVR